MAIATPPFRTSLLTANGVPFATDNGDIQTTRDWWMYWNQLTDRSNANSKLATEGPHAGRPVPDGMPDGALYYESDRGVIYAHANGVWQYLAGTMWGTLVPDQRPADLGTHDAGFDFRTTVAPPREFIWSQTAWVETTPVGGAVNLTHPNVVTKVGSTAGSIVEGGINDLGPTGNITITAAGNVGIQTSTPAVMLSLGAVFVPKKLAIYESADGSTFYGFGIGSGILRYESASDHVWYFGSTERMHLSSSGTIAFPNLPNANPGAGTKQLWYDPADGNRVKFAP